MPQAPDAPKDAMCESRDQPGELYRKFSRLEWIVQRLPLNPNSWVQADVDLQTTSSLYGRMMQQPRLRVCACSQGGRASCATVEDGWQ